MGLEVALRRAQAARIAVLAHQPVVQGGEVQRPLVIDLLQPGGDGGLEIRRKMFLLTTPVGDSVVRPVQMITHRVFVNAQEPGDGVLL